MTLVREKKAYLGSNPQPLMATTDCSPQLQWALKRIDPSDESEESHLAFSKAANNLTNAMTTLSESITALADSGERVTVIADQGEPLIARFSRNDKPGEPKLIADEKTEQLSVVVALTLAVVELAPRYIELVDGAGVVLRQLGRVVGVEEMKARVYCAPEGHGVCTPCPDCGKKVKPVITNDQFPGKFCMVHFNNLQHLDKGLCCKMKKTNMGMDMGRKVWKSLMEHYK